MPFAIEELLRFYAPVTMARIVAKDVEIGGRTMREGDWVLLPFPSANRDPEFFDRADEFVIDREKNRHVAFGLGIHRCLGSNLARMELTVAVEEWMRRIPDFELDDPDAVRWSTGQVRGPRAADAAAAGRAPTRATPPRHRRRCRVKIPFDRDLCQGHNRCYLLAPELFDVDDEGYAVLRVDGDVPDDLHRKAQLAADNCPEYAITLVED